MSWAVYDVNREQGERDRESAEVAWEQSIDYEAIAQELAAEICDTHPSLRSGESRLMGALQRFFDTFQGVDDVAKAGVELGVSKPFDDDFVACWVRDNVSGCDRA